MKLIKTLPQALLVGTGLFFSVHTAHAAPADLDPTFSADGKVTTALGVSGSNAICRDVLIQSDGKIVTAGFFGDNWAIVRHTSGGVLDTTFNYDGKVTTNYGGNDLGLALAQQSDGKIVAVGSGQGSSFVGITRYLTNGTHDTTFNADGDTDGKVGYNFGYSSAIEGIDVAIQSDGKIIVAGQLLGGNGDFVVARLLSNGALDTTFSGDGVTVADFGGDDRAESIAIQSDGKIVVSGTQYNVGSESNMIAARFTTSGALDTTFSGDGLVTVDFSGSESAYGMALQSDGKIVLGGNYSPAYNPNLYTPPAFAAVRLTTNGSLDTTFSGDGIIIAPISSNDYCWDIAVQSNGKIVQVGSSDFDFAVVRYNSNGTLDTSFSGDGKTTTDFDSDSTDNGYAVALQSDGKIVVAGTSGEKFALARYLGSYVDPAANSVNTNTSNATSSSAASF